jgi:cyclic pyranopterin phosphate synthase
MAPTAIVDRHGRPLANLRISVTDRCNLRCSYCMPEVEYTWLPRDHILSFEEISRLVDAFTEVGVEKVRLTGGEPLLRRDLARLVEILAAKPAIRDFAMTTNGVDLASRARELAEAGLHRITVSLDTLRSDRFVTLTRRDALPSVLAGIEAASNAGFRSLKIDTVVLRGQNEDELVDLVEFGKRWNAEVRFIEYMDVGGATRWSFDQVVTREEILKDLVEAYGPIRPLAQDSPAPAERFLLPDGTVFGIVASTTAPFCGTCDRSRLTADGMWFRCLYAREGTDLRAPLRAGAGPSTLAGILREAWTGRTDRGAEDRLRERGRSPLVAIEDLRKNPHLEMHTRGG